jgi:hypothetical protein
MERIQLIRPADLRPNPRAKVKDGVVKFGVSASWPTTEFLGRRCAMQRRLRRMSDLHINGFEHLREMAEPSNTSPRPNPKPLKGLYGSDIGRSYETYQNFHRRIEKSEFKA